MSVAEMINSQHRGDGQIISGVYITMTYRDNTLIWLYVGTKASGPMLQYQPDVNGVYDGKKHVDLTGDNVDAGVVPDRNLWPDGAWTPIYSRGDYRRNYACGGHWSGHTRNLHPAVGDQTRHDRKSECLVADGGALLRLPDGIKGNVSVTKCDCSLGWPVWYPSAREAIDARLTPTEIASAKLPQASKTHLIPHEDSSVALLHELIEIYNV